MALPQVTPSLGHVRDLAAKGYRRVPVKRELYADSFTTVEVLRALRAQSSHVFMLESAEADQHWGRYSFIGANPTMEISCLDGRLHVLTNVEGADPVVEMHRVEHPGPFLR